MAKKTIVKQEMTQIKNSETGEVIETSVTQTVKLDQEPSFIKLYTKDMCKLNDVPKSANSVLNALLEHTNYRNEIVLASHTKDRICDNLKIKKPSLDNAILKLVKSELIVRVGRGVFSLNPYVFGKGKWQDIKELQMTWDYGKSGRTLEPVKTSETTQPALPFNEEEQEVLEGTIQEAEIIEETPST